MLFQPLIYNNFVIFIHTFIIHHISKGGKTKIAKDRIFGKGPTPNVGSPLVVHILVRGSKLKIQRITFSVKGVEPSPAPM